MSVLAIINGRFTRQEKTATGRKRWFNSLDSGRSLGLSCISAALNFAGLL
jgi:hypothetical protein